jgi:uncharacterized membrane protein YeaQ/YmgE (transglycosylase-associated protein family)
VIGIDSIIIMLIVGAIAGWLSGKIVRRSKLGLLGNIISGIVGAFIGVWLLTQLGFVPFSGFIGSIINATIGAIILLTVVGRTRPRRTDDDSPYESAAYRALVRRVFREEAANILDHEPAVRFVPRPFEEALEHPQTRFNVESKSFILEIYGPAGLALAVASVFVVGVVVALWTGLYAPGGAPSGSVSPSQAPSGGVSPSQKAPSGGVSPSKQAPSQTLHE